MTRPRLEQALRRVPPAGVGLVVAAAGYGKSVLLAQWAASSPSTRICQISVTHAHNDPALFGRSLASSVAAAAPEFDASVGDFVSAASIGLGDSYVAKFLVQLEELTHDLVIVVDDAHNLAGDALAEDLHRLCTRLPDNVRIILGARWDPPLNLRSMRMQGRLIELRAADLAFDPDEASKLVAAVSGTHVSATQIEALVARTDGWAAGLQLAAIAIQRSSDVDRLIENFTGSDGLVADYLTEEVLRHLEPRIRLFLLRTSVLEWFDLELCNAVVGEGDAQEILDELVARSLFVVPLGGRDRRFRYHHLFADLLRYHLRYGDAALEHESRRAAADWLLAHGAVAEAIEQLLAVGDHQAVVDVVEQHGQTFLERSETATVCRWLEEVRDRSLNPSPAVLVNLLAAQVGASQTTAGIQTYNKLMRLPGLDLGSEAAASALYASFGHDTLPGAEVRRAGAAALAAVPRLDELDGHFLGVGGRATIETMGTFMPALSDLLDGDVLSSRAQFERALELPGTQYLIWRLHALGAVALTMALAGQSTEAAGVATTCLELAERERCPRHIAVIYAHLALTRVALDRLELADATTHLQRSEEIAHRAGRAAYIALARLFRCERTSEGGGAGQALEDLTAWSPMSMEPRLIRGSAVALAARLWLRGNDPDRARRALARAPDSPSSLPLQFDLALRVGDREGAHGVLSGWAPPDGDIRARVERSLRLAALRWAEGDREAAEHAARAALELAEPEELRRPVTEAVGALATLESVERKSPTRFLRSVLQVSQRAGAEGAPRDFITDREREVLYYLPTRLSNGDIAAALFVSKNTVKTHLSHLYSKLGVSDRDAAIVRATEMGLL